MDARALKSEESRAVVRVKGSPQRLPEGDTVNAPPAMARTTAKYWVGATFSWRNTAASSTTRKPERRPMMPRLPWSPARAARKRKNTLKNPQRDQASRVGCCFFVPRWGTPFFQIRVYIPRLTALRMNTCSITGMEAQRLEESCMAEKHRALAIISAMAPPRVRPAVESCFVTGPPSVPVHQFPGGGIQRGVQLQDLPALRLPGGIWPVDPVSADQTL